MLAPTADQQPNPNTPTLDTYRDKMREFGRIAGQGGNIGFTALLQLAEGAFLNALTHVPREGEAEGDQAKLADDYATAQGLANQNNAKAPNRKKLKSEFALMIETGSNPKWGKQEPLGFFGRLLARHNKLRQAKAADLMDKYNLLTRASRKIKRMDVLPSTDDELDELCYKPGAKPLTAKRYIKGLLTNINKLIEGKVKNCNETDDSPKLKDAAGSLRARLVEIERAENKAAKDAKAAAKVTNANKT